jgi:hypothetical protein
MTATAMPHAAPLNCAARIKRLRTIARLMDSAIKIPGTRISFGADSILGLIPGAGDVVAAGISLFAVAEAHQLGVPKAILMKMLANVAIDTGLGSIPLVGDVFDMFFKSNTKNLALLLEHFAREGHL